MPELPEVETTVNGLSRLITGKKITKLVFFRENLRYQLVPEWIDIIENTSIKNISRRAKHIIIELDNAWLLCHLGMSGSFRICEASEPKRLHDHVEFVLGDKNLLRYHDPRRFGSIRLYMNKKQLDEAIAHYGPEPLSAEFNAQYLLEKLSNKTSAIKTLIMNQEIVVGVGNIYACEALFMAQILPTRPAKTATLTELTDLVAAIKKILKLAIKAGGTTLKDFENAESKPGYFQQQLWVYGRDNQPCLKCQTTIKAIKLTGRNSFYCPNCQK